MARGFVERFICVHCTLLSDSEITTNEHNTLRETVLLVCCRFIRGVSRIVVVMNLSNRWLKSILLGKRQSVGSVGQRTRRMWPKNDIPKVKKTENTDLNALMKE